MLLPACNLPLFSDHFINLSRILPDVCISNYRISTKLDQNVRAPRSPNWTLPLFRSMTFSISWWIILLLYTLFKLYEHMLCSEVMTLLAKLVTSGNPVLLNLWCQWPVFIFLRSSSTFILWINYSLSTKLANISSSGPQKPDGRH